jgi:glutathione reductase (NADPH)
MNSDDTNQDKQGSPHYDLLVIGAGSGGLAAAKRAASYGARVAIVENDRVGGTCVIRGCVPKKLLVYASQLGHLRELAEIYGWPAAPTDISWPTLFEGMHGLVNRLEKVHEQHLATAGVTLLRGTARFRGPHEIDIDGRSVRASRMVVATGAKPVVPDIPGAELCMVSNDLFNLDHCPKSAILVGGGYIAVEFAGVLQNLGCQTTLVVRSRVLRDFDDDVGDAVAEAMRQQGIHVVMPAEVKAVQRAADDSGMEMTISRRNDGNERTAILRAETITLFAIGRAANTHGLGLEDIGVDVRPNGEVPVDANHDTNIPHIHAVGDVTGCAALTPVAIKAGRTLADRLFGGSDAVMSYDNIPTAVFFDPPVSVVGMTERAAIEQHGADNIQVFRAQFTPLKYSAAPPEKKRKTLMKLVVHKSTDRVLGCHMMGDDAPEIIQGFAVAIHAGATKAMFDSTVAIHPTQAEEFVLMA